MVPASRPSPAGQNFMLTSIETLISVYNIAATRAKTAKEFFPECQGAETQATTNTLGGAGWY